MNIASSLTRITSQPRPLRFLASRLLWHTGLSSLLTIDCGTYRLRFYPSACSTTLWFDPKARSVDEQIFRKLLNKGDVVIDVGANIGSLSLAAAAIVGSSGTVYSIEAHPQTYKYLLGNIRLNKAHNVVAVNVACGKEDGTVHFSDQKSDDQNCVTESGLTVPVTSLDAIVTLLEKRRIALLKIDVEGYEKFVLEGATRILARTDAVYFESWVKHFEKFGYQLRDILTLLHDFGFGIYQAREGIALEKIDEDYVSLRCENLLAMRTATKFRN
ncbi:MAG TPA: FkbM family methyltransferase [Terriglobales bacterium]|nr:FkbM family methyltransferase [Terriglobales bacterium]